MDRVRKQIGLADAELATQHKTGYGSTKKYISEERGVVVAVLDTGAAEHPDIHDRIIYFKDFVGKSDKMYDDNSHGTHICGILCGNGRLSAGKYRGIAPDSRLVVCKVLNQKGDGTADNMLKALEFIRRYRKQLDIRILNISVGIGELKDRQVTEKLRILTECLWDEGIVVVCAAGNKGPADGSISSVGGSNKVITVGCHDGDYFKEDKNRCEIHSGRGNRFDSVRKPDIVAPGTLITSCNYSWNAYTKDKKASYTEKTGTSMATPIVSGCAALLLAKEPWLSPNQVKERILYTAKDLGESWNKQGWGMINARRLLENDMSIEQYVAK